MSRIAYVNGQYVPYAQAGVHVEVCHLFAWS